MSEVFAFLSPEPEAVQSFNISQPSDTAQTLELKVICPEERRRNGHITKFTYTSTVERDVSYEKCSATVLEPCKFSKTSIVDGN